MESVPAILTIFGALLLVAAIVGELKSERFAIPRLTGVKRWIVFGVGLVFLCFGVASTFDLPGARQHQAAKFTIVDDLGKNQQSEAVQVFLDGDNVGRIVVDEDHKHAELVVNAPSIGVIRYRLEGTQTVVTTSKERVTRILKGEGQIDVSSGSRYSLLTTSGTPNSAVGALVPVP
jgi:hypothetical protein